MSTRAWTHVACVVGALGLVGFAGCERQEEAAPAPAPTQDTTQQNGAAQDSQTPPAESNPAPPAGQSN